MITIKKGETLTIPSGPRRGAWLVMAVTGFGSLHLSAWLQRIGKRGRPLASSRDRMNLTENQICTLKEFLT